MEKSLVIKNSASVQMNIEEDYIIGSDGVVEPYLSFSLLRSLYASNLYHQRAIKIKAGLLSQILQSQLDRYLPPGTNAKAFLFRLMLNLETYGSAFMEKAGIPSNFTLYNMNTYYSRVDIDHNTYQHINMKTKAIEALHIKYDSILSDHYGEPDYIAVIKQIATLYKADHYNDMFFDNGGKPELAFIFEDSDPSDEQVSAITDFVKKNFSGYGNAHKNLILTTGEGDGQTKPKIRIEQIGKIEDLSFQKLKEVGRDEIAAAHGVPPRLLGIVQGSGLGGSGELIAQMKMFLEVTINPKIELVEWFFQKNGIDLKIERFDVNSLKSDEDIADTLVEKGIITAIEKRNILG